MEEELQGEAEPHIFTEAKEIEYLCRERKNMTGFSVQSMVTLARLIIFYQV